MKPIVTGIVVEYNPFHNGHLHHITEAKRITNCDVLVAIMSPNYVQRGEPAYINKWTRTKAALDHGVDLVIELPTYFAIQSADYFAMAAIELLKLANIDSLVYGAESLTALPSTFDASLMEKGHSYAHANQSSTPNNILANAYEANLKNTNIKPIRIQRTNSYHDLDIQGSISSASAIRKAHRENEGYTHTTPMNLDNYQTHIFEDYLPFIKYQLISHSPEDLSQINIITEGIENLFIKNRHKDLIEDGTNKRYTSSRIKRSLMNIYLNTKKDEPALLTQFRVLGMNKRAQVHLKTLPKTSYTTQFKRYHNKNQELAASELYALPYSKDYQDLTYQQELECLIRTK